MTRRTPEHSIEETDDFPILRIAARPGDTAIFFSDVHAPIHDRGAMDIVVQAHQLLRPSVSIAGGDIFDAQPLSSHRRSALQAIQYGSLAAEAETLADTMDEIARNSGYAVAIEGNHEERVVRLVDEFPALLGAVEWHTPFSTALSLWDTIPDGSAIKLGPVMAFHGHELSGSLARYSAASVLAAYPGQSTIYGHCHRVDAATRPTLREGRQVIHGAWTFGHLSNPRRQDYARAIRGGWQQGFGHVEFWDRGDGRVGFTMHPIRIFPTTGCGRIAHVAGRTLRG